MHIETHTGLQSPEGIWWKPAHKSEKVWVGIAFAWCMVLFAMMPLWHWKGGQNPSGIRARTTPQAYGARIGEFIKQYQTGDDRGMPIVTPPPGADIYLAAVSFQWFPILRLQKNAEYTLPPLVARREPRVLALPDQRQLPGRAGLRLRPAGHPERVG